MAIAAIVAHASHTMPKVKAKVKKVEANVKELEVVRQVHARTPTTVRLTVTVTLAFSIGNTLIGVEGTMMVISAPMTCVAFVVVAMLPRLIIIRVTMLLLVDVDVLVTSTLGTGFAMVAIPIVRSAQKMSGEEVKVKVKVKVKPLPLKVKVKVKVDVQVAAVVDRLALEVSTQQRL